jgi:hypothetical protein
VTDEARRRETSILSRIEQAYVGTLRHPTTMPNADAGESRLDDTLLLLTPLDVETALRRSVEAALIRRLKEAPTDVAEFLYNKPMKSRAFSGVLEVTMRDGVKVDGLEAPFTDSC